MSRTRIASWLLVFTVIFATSLSSTSFAANEWARADFFENSGGLNDGFGPTAIQDNEAADIQNMTLSTGGFFGTRDGFTHLNSTTIGATVDANGIIYYRQADQDEFLVGVFSDNTVRKMDYGGGDPDGTWDDITGTLTFTVDQDDLADLAIAEDVVLFTDGLGTTGLNQWTGSGNASAISGAPNCKYVSYHKRMAFAAGDSSNPSLLYFTDIGDVTDWSTGLSGNVSLDETDGSVIRGLQKLADSLYIFTDNSIWRLSGDDKDTFTVQRMISGTGTLSNKSIVQISGQLFFQSKEGDVYLYNGGFELERISSKIQGTIDGLNKSRLPQAVGVLWDNDYHLALSNAASLTNNLVLVFDTFHLGWSKYVGMNINAADAGNISDGTEVVFFGDYSGFISKYPDGTSDAGVAISDFYLTKQFRFPQLPAEKYLRLIKVYATQKGSYNLNVETRSDFEGAGETKSFELSGGGALWDVAVWDVDLWPGEQLVTGRIELDKGKEFFQIRFFNENISEPWEVKGWSMFLEGSENI